MLDSQIGVWIDWCIGILGIMDFWTDKGNRLISMWIDMQVPIDRLIEWFGVLIDL